ncbi:hypothetical protein BJ742DRAFT_842712 [Cladochytrium replicatum]|nr:hypothetical protein BJ742DRAFT_842712 [Cladochytrium replicatum]
MKLIATGLLLCSILRWVAALTDPRSTFPGMFTQSLAYSTYITSLYAVGTQNYNCTTSALDRPEAALYQVGSNPYSNKTATRGRPVGYHYFLFPADTNGGKATWQLNCKQPQKVTTKLLNQTTFNAVNINWLITIMTSSSGSVFSNVGFVIRADTRFGTIQDSCTSAPGVVITKQPYSAVYHFYTKASGTSPGTSKLYEECGDHEDGNHDHR